jgi:hypothetical protein
MKVFKSLFKLVSYFISDSDLQDIKKEFSSGYEMGLKGSCSELESFDTIEENKEECQVETIIENEKISILRDWAVNKINNLHESDKHRNAKALAAEFDEWINVPEDSDEIEYLCLDSPGWTNEQEIDVQ